MSQNEDAAGLGCCGIIVVLALVGIVLQYLLQILLVGLVVALVVLVVALAVQWSERVAERRAERERCPACNSWANSVVLCDAGPADGQLCPTHRARAHRIDALERELRLDED